MKKLNHKGSSHIVLILAVAVIAAVGVVGYRVVSNNASDQTDSSSNISSAENHSVSIPKQFNNTADINQASKALDNTQVDSSINPNQLDQDLNSLL